MNPLLARLIEKRNALQETVDSTIATVDQENREEFSDSEAKNVADANTEITSLDSRIEGLAGMEKRAQAAHDIASEVAGTGARTSLVQVTSEAAPTLTPGQFVVALGKANRGDTAASAIVTRALQNQAVADNLGVIPADITGGLVKLADDARRITPSMRNLPMPASGSTFLRPRVTQRTAVSAQAAQYDVLDSAKLLITKDTITKSTIGGAVSLSEQDVDFSDPSIYDLVLSDLAQVYGNAAEEVAATAIEAKVTTNVVVWNTASTDYADLHAAIADATGTVYTDAKSVPDTLYVAVDRWEQLVGFVDGSGRPLFNSLNPQNAPGDVRGLTGTGPLGMRVVVSSAFTAGFIAVGASNLIEWFEQDKGSAAIAAPSTLSVTLAYRGYVATNIQAVALCGLEDA